MNGGARTYRVEAIVLRRRDLGETDRIVTLFTLEHGKLDAVAKGARGARGRLAAASEPGTWFTGLLARGQSLEVVAQAQVKRVLTAARTDLMRLSYACHLLELTGAGIDSAQPMPDLWKLLRAALLAVETAEQPAMLARAFELRALSMMGFEPQWSHCVEDGEPLPAGGAYFHPRLGGALCRSCADSRPGFVLLGRETVSVLDRLVSQPLSTSAAMQASPRVQSELFRCLVPYIRHHLAVELRSLSVIPELTGHG